MDQLVRSIRENFRTLGFRMDITSFGPYIQTAVRIFPVWTSQLVNKGILLDTFQHFSEIHDDSSNIDSSNVTQIV